MNNRTTVERKSERELVVTRTFNGPARIVFEAWTKPELLKQWWAPKSTGLSLLSCAADGRHWPLMTRAEQDKAHIEVINGGPRRQRPQTRIEWSLRRFPPSNFVHG